MFFLRLFLGFSISPPTLSPPCSPRLERISTKRTPIMPKAGKTVKSKGKSIETIEPVRLKLLLFWGFFFFLVVVIIVLIVLSAPDTHPFPPCSLPCSQTHSQQAPYEILL